jgi:hypothetical protein
VSFEGYPVKLEDDLLYLANKTGDVHSYVTVSHIEILLAQSGERKRKGSKRALVGAS